MSEQAGDCTEFDRSEAGHRLKVDLLDGDLDAMLETEHDLINNNQRKLSPNRKRSFEQLAPTPPPLQENGQSASATSRRHLPTWMAAGSPAQSVGIPESAGMSEMRLRKTQEILQKFSPFGYLRPKRRKISPNEHDMFLKFKNSKRVVVFDLETTGFSGQDQIIEIGAVECLQGGVPSGFLFHSYISVTADVHPKAEEVHGFSKPKLSAYPQYKFVLRQFERFVGSSLLVSHNTNFDSRILKQEFQRLHDEEQQHESVTDKTATPSPNHSMSTVLPTTNFQHENMLCTMVHFRHIFPGHSADLDAICHYFGIDRSSRVSHGALTDARLTAELFKFLCSLDDYEHATATAAAAPEDVVAADLGQDPVTSSPREAKPGHSASKDQEQSTQHRQLVEVDQEIKAKN